MNHAHLSTISLPTIRPRRFWYEAIESSTAAYSLKTFVCHVELACAVKSVNTQNEAIT